MMWTAAYWRYKVRETREFEEEHEAVNFLMSGEEYGELSSEAVLRDGVEVYDHAALHELFSRLDWKPMPPTIDGIASVTLIETSIVKDPPAPGMEIRRVGP